MAWEAGRGGSRGGASRAGGRSRPRCAGAAARFRRVANRALATAGVSGTAAPELSLHWQGSAAEAAGGESSASCRLGRNGCCRGSMGRA